ncbi:MAG TPA: HTTM domain-containing protein [Gemmataceae bacterium]|nr:HTTM domain-containing protein [Gemmataceae bacterium]
MTTASPIDPPANPVVRVARGWNRFWFSPGDPTLLGLIRICCGLVTLYVHLAYSADLREFFAPDAWADRQTINEIRHDWPWGRGPWGWEQLQVPPKDEPLTPAEAEFAKHHWPADPREAPPYFRGLIAWSVWYHVPMVDDDGNYDPTWMWVVHVSGLVVIFLFALGFCTRVTSVLTWVVAVSYIQRSPPTLFGQDTMMNILLLYLMVGPSGAALSVDRLLRRWWQVRQARKKHRPPPPWLPPAPSVSANFALRLIQVNLCFIYFVSALSKLEGRTWWAGTAIWLTLANYEFSPMRFGPYAAFLRFLCDHRWLWEVVMSGGVVFTFVVELGFPFLVWNRRLRPVMVSLAVMMHTGIALSMGLRTFSMMMMVMDLSFVSPAVVHRLLGMLRRAVPLEPPQPAAVEEPPLAEPTAIRTGRGEKQRAKK